MKLYLIRHGQTEGNRAGRYIGCTDERLCPQGIAAIQENMRRGCYPQHVDALAVSPMLRCIETASLLFPDMVPQIVEDFRETDFGLFENKNYEELSGVLEYQQWINSGGTLPFPMGESRQAFSKRCCTAFDTLRGEWTHQSVQTGALVVHGGTIMAVLSHLLPSDYYAWQVRNGNGFCLTLDGDRAEAEPLFYEGGTRD